jgi:tetratricopeptide (TPR) repeat protein
MDGYTDFSRRTGWRNLPGLGLALTLSVTSGAQQPREGLSLQQRQQWFQRLLDDPEGLSVSEIRWVVNAYCEAVSLGDTATEPSLREVEASLRGGRVKLSGALRAFFEYWAANRAITQGDSSDLEASGAALIRLERDHPQLEKYRVERALVLADMQRALGQFGAALAGLERIERTSAPALSDRLASSLFGIRGEVLRETGRLDEAVAATRKSGDLATASGDRDAIHTAFLREQELLLVRGEFAEAHRRVDAALEKRQESGIERALLLAYLGYAEAGLSRSEPEWLPRARATLDAARKEGAKGHLRIRVDLKRLDLALRAGDVAGAQSALADCEASLPPPAADAPSDVPGRDRCEAIAGVTRLALLRGDGLEALSRQREQHGRALAAVQQQWRGQPLRRGGIGFLHLDDRRELLASAIELELTIAVRRGRTDGAEAAFAQVLPVQSLTSLSRGRGAPPCSVHEVQRDFLLPGHAALVFLPARRHGHAFLVERDRITHFELAGELPYAPALRRFVSALRRAPGTDGANRETICRALATDGTTLRAALLPEPLLARLGTLRGLTVVGGDLLGSVPLEAIPLADGTLLGEALPIDALPSLPLGLHLARSAPSAAGPSRVLLLGCTAPAAEVVLATGCESFAFPWSTLESSLQKYGTTAVVDVAATCARILGAAYAAADVVHVVGHAAPEIDERGPGLVARDGVLRPGDLESIGVHGTVLVSMCGGGDGPRRVGDGDVTTSFAGLFLWQGARAVVASRNVLLAKDHLRMMASVHVHLAGGDAPAVAVQKARRELAREGDLFARSQRALVQVHGDGQRPLRAR